MPTRHAVFETNSSSTHSISVCGESRKCNLVPTERDGRLVILSGGGEFGWEEETYDDPQSKLNYVVAMICTTTDSAGIRNDHRFHTLCEVVRDYTGYFLELDGDDLGYVDHQSVDIIEDYSADYLRDLIFDSKYRINTDNDNR
jgi:hypothetical protein